MSRFTSEDRLGVWLLLGCALFLVLGAGAAGVIRASEPRRDPSTQCVIGRPVSGETVVLIDCTDPMTGEQARGVLSRLRQLEATDLTPNSRLSVWVLGENNEGQLRRIFCRCHPGSRANPVVQNPRFVAAACESLFAAPLTKALRDAPLRAKATRSPILEGIRTLQQSEFRPTAAPRRLILVSDLLQNSPACSFYTHSPDFIAFRSSPRLARLIPDLAGVDVEVVRIPRRAEDLDTELRLLDFWQAYFKAAGAQTVRVGRLT